MNLERVEFRWVDDHHYTAHRVQVDRQVQRDYRINRVSQMIMGADFNRVYVVMAVNHS